MKPLRCFEVAWARCDELGAMQAYLAAQLTAALKPDELLRAEWVARVSSLDLYVHELVAQYMLETFEGVRQPSKAFFRFQIPLETMLRIRNAASPSAASAAFDFEVRSRLGFVSYQDPDKIAEGIRLISDISLWNTVVLSLGSSTATADADAKTLKRSLSLIVERRNKIAHEGDMQPTTPRTPWPIQQTDVQYVTRIVRQIVYTIDSVV